MATPSRRRRGAQIEANPKPYEAIDWKTFNLKQLNKFTETEEEAKKFAIHLGLLSLEPGPCPGKGQPCEAQMNLTRDQNNFRCPTCDKKMSINCGTWWDRSHLSYAQGLELIYYFQTPMTQEQVMHEVDIGSKSTIVNWYSSLRELPGTVLANLPHHQIGGPGLIVEIDESHIRTRKYDVGRVLVSQAIWVFGGISRNTKECFVVQVERRDAETLLPLIQQYIAPRSIIFSDMWKAYNGIEDLLEQYTHGQINHSKEFLHPVQEFVHTQNIEAMWGSIKRTLPTNLTEENRGAYFMKYIYEKRFGWRSLSLGQRFHKYCQHLDQVCPSPFPASSTI
jgi:transposase-like protein